MHLVMWLWPQMAFIPNINSTTGEEIFTGISTDVRFVKFEDMATSAFTFRAPSVIFTR